MAENTNYLGKNAVPPVGYFYQYKTIEAQMALYRSYLHEVNNALAGIGSLAEALKGSQSATMDSNLDLMAHAARKSGVLQQRIRALYYPSELLQINLVEFFKENRDLMEMIMPRTQKISYEFSGEALLVKANTEKLWTLLALMLLWGRESLSERMSFELTAKSLKLMLLDPRKAVADDNWMQAIESAAKNLHAEGFVSAKELLVVWA